METIKILEIIGTSKKNWEDAANNAVKEASETVNGITGAEVVGQTAKVSNGKIAEYRTTVKVAFKVKSKR
ncbi:MAG: dodecin family protein [Acidobacteriota bacterium]